MNGTHYDWGDTVCVKITAPAEYRPGAAGSICGNRIITTEETANIFLSEMGTTLYIVEFGDGFSPEIPEQFLELCDQEERI